MRVVTWLEINQLLTSNSIANLNCGINPLLKPLNPLRFVLQRVQLFDFVCPRMKEMWFRSLTEISCSTLAMRAIAV
jgi:hypothetical protein